MDPTIEQLAPLLSIGIIIFISIIALFGVIIGLLLWCKIFSKTGYSWAMGLIVLVPFGSAIMMLVLAFSDWPILKIKALKTQPVEVTTD